jgi:multisubunit Na+/H+ antiporter MnhB subunit
MLLLLLLAAAAAGMWHRMPDGDFMGFSGEAGGVVAELLLPLVTVRVN